MGEVSNIEKQQNYKDQMNRLNKSIREGFLLEALFIEYAIMEDRCESILRHAGVFNPERHNSISSKLRRIEELSRNKTGLVRKYITPELLSDIRTWKEQRNRFIHALMKQKFTHEELQEITDQGKCIVATLSSKATSFRRAQEKKVKMD